MHEKTIKYFSTFSGIGGFELGIERAVYHRTKSTLRNPSYGHQSHSGGEQKRETVQLSRASCVGFSEIDKYASQIYQHHFPEHRAYGDITKIDTKDIPDFELLVGGFPCQAFSIAGKRMGFKDTRGTMFFELARILADKQPRLFVFENVKGILSHDEGRTVRTIFTTIDELGYDADWQVLNSKDFGVPQNRERIYIVGHLRGTPAPEVFPLAETDRDPAEPAGYVSNTLTARYEKAQRVGTYIGESELDAQIRRLTPIECERLQGFPDGWTTQGVTPTGEIIEISDTQRYKTLGNAVTVNVIEAIMSKLLA